MINSLTRHLRYEVETTDYSNTQDIDTLYNMYN